MSVTNGERGQGVGLGYHGVVASRHCLTTDRLHHVFGSESHLFHLQTGPDKRTQSLGVVVANLLREVVVVRPVAALVFFGLCLGVDALQGCLYLGADARTKTRYRTAVGQRDGFVIVDLDEIVDDAAIGLDACITIFGANVALAICLQEGVGEHSRTGALQIVSLASRRVHYLIPHARLLVLPFQDGVKVLLQQFDEFAAALIVSRYSIQHFDECHRVPSLRTSPAVLTQSGLLVGPEHIPVLVVGMTVEACLRVERTIISNGELVHGIVVDARHCLGIFLRDRSCQTAVGQSHEDTIEPHLIGVDGLVPIHFIYHRARLLLQLLHQRLHGDEVFLLGQLLIHASHEMTCTDIVEVIVQNVVPANLAFLVDHRVGVELAVVEDVLTAVAQVGVEHTFQLDAHHVTPFWTCGEVQQVGLRIALHLRACHPFRVVLVGHLGERQTTVHIELVEGDVARLAGDGVPLLHTVETTVSDGDIVDERVLFQSDDLHTVA